MKTRINTTSEKQRYLLQNRDISNAPFYICTVRLVFIPLNHILTGIFMISAELLLNALFCKQTILLQCHCDVIVELD